MKDAALYEQRFGLKTPWSVNKVDLSLTNQRVVVEFVLKKGQPSLAALVKLASGFTDVWLFRGPHQGKQAQAFAASHARMTLVPGSGQGPNAQDFHLTFYLGDVAATRRATRVSSRSGWSSARHSPSIWFDR